MLRKLHYILLFLLIIATAAAQQKDLILWYDKPASIWNEALPIGNGRLGAMVFGKATNELIQLNEEKLWTGGPVNPNPEAQKYLQPLRNALFKDSIGQAVKLLHKMQGPNTEMYQPLGVLMINQQFSGELINYRRDLNISTAIATTSFTSDGVTYTRELFSSAPNQVIIIRLKGLKHNSQVIQTGAILNFISDAGWPSI